MLGSPAWSQAKGMDSTIRLSFRYLQSDYTRAIRTHFGSRRRLAFDVAVIVLVAAAGLCLLRWSGDIWGVVFLGLAAVFALVLIVGLVIVPRVIFRSTSKLHDEYFLDFSPNGIHFRTAQIDSELQWSMYSRALVDAHFYLLYYGPRSYTIIPKRVFQNAEQQTAFEQLLTQNIPQIVRRTA